MRDFFPRRMRICCCSCGAILLAHLYVLAGAESLAARAATGRYSYAELQARAEAKYEARDFSGAASDFAEAIRRMEEEDGRPAPLRALMTTASLAEQGGNVSQALELHKPLIAQLFAIVTQQDDDTLTFGQDPLSEEPPLDRLSFAISAVQLALRVIHAASGSSAATKLLAAAKVHLGEAAPWQDVWQFPGRYWPGLTAKAW